MTKTITAFIVFTILLATRVSGQAKEYYLNDIFEPDLKGPVRSVTEYIVGGTDTLRIMQVTYTRTGTRASVYIHSTHSEMGFINDTTCYKTKGKEIISTNCKNDSPTGTTISFGENGLINEIDMKGPDQTIGFFPEYNRAKRLATLNTSITKSGSFQFIGTLNFTFNANGSIKQSEAQGGEQPQGKTDYTYNNQNLLIKTVRSDDKKIFQVEYAGHDTKGNWTLSKYQNGVKVNRVIEYY